MKKDTAGWISVVLYILAIYLTFDWFNLKLAIIMVLWLSANNLERHLL